MFTREEHWHHFVDFCRWELASGGPDPQLATVAEMSKSAVGRERIWRAGCYIAVYNVAYAEALWRGMPWKKFNNGYFNNVAPWLEKHWDKITTRVERRCVRRPDWMAEFLHDYGDFVRDYKEFAHQCSKRSPKEAYDFAWDRVTQVARLGRYVALKLLEYLKRYEGLPIEAPDIRPAGGWSPRNTLAALWDEPSIAVKSDDPRLLVHINSLCDLTLERLRKFYDLHQMDLFKLQVMLCEYRESWEGERQYPGRSLDSELKYGLRAEKDWRYESDIWRARKVLFPYQHLGELNGWAGPREGPALALARHRYLWSDLKYDYNNTRSFACPLRWGEKPVASLARVALKPRSTNGMVRVWPIIQGQLYQSGRWTQMDLADCKATVARYGLTGIANFWKDDPRLKTVVPWYRFWPLPDGKRIPSEVLLMADVVAAEIAAGGRVLTMCYGGRNRSGLISALVALRLLNKYSGKQAVALVKQARKGALVNANFVDFLESMIEVVPPGGRHHNRQPARNQRLW